MAFTQSHFSIDAALDELYTHPLAGPGYMMLRDMTKTDLDTVIGHFQRNAEHILDAAPTSDPYGRVEFLQKVRRSLRRYTRLYGAFVVVDMPIFAIERCLERGYRRPQARVG